MKEPGVLETQASERVVFSALADVVSGYRDPSFRVWGVKVSVEPSRFGTEEAISIRLRSKAGEAEIGKILVIPLDHGDYLFKVPVNQTGGAAMPDLDRDGQVFDNIVGSVLERLRQLGLVNLSRTEKGPLGFRPPQEGHAS